jgi:hypothetical protein
MGFLLPGIVPFFAIFIKLVRGRSVSYSISGHAFYVCVPIYARVAELVDALASGASVLRDVEVQVLFRAPGTLQFWALSSVG